MNYQFDPIIPIELIGLIGFALISLTSFVQWKGSLRLKLWKRICLILFRSLALCLPLLILLQPSIEEEERQREMRSALLVGLDTSLSMLHEDEDFRSRIDKAKELLAQSSWWKNPNQEDLLFYEFNSHANLIPPEDLKKLKAQGAETLYHRSIQSLLNSLPSGSEAKGLLLLSDGHDFEGINPIRTALFAQAREVPIFAIPLGSRGRVRDVSISMASFQPYIHVGQESSINAIVSFIGSEYEQVHLQLLREGKVVQNKTIASEQYTEVPISFNIQEEEVGQFEYEIRVLPLEGEADTDNNVCYTYLNIIDRQIRLLMLEGSPHWDSSFLQRSLLSNDKYQLDMITRYSSNPPRVRRIRKSPGPKELEIPNQPEGFKQWDLIILGRHIEQLLNSEQQEALRLYISEHSGGVIFARGPAIESEQSHPIQELQPVHWEKEGLGRIQVKLTREGQGLAALSLSNQQGPESYTPKYFSSLSASHAKPSSIPMAMAIDERGESLPAMYFRRYGRGQVLSVGLEGLWRWAFNEKVDDQSFSQFGRWWDQLILWMVAGGEFIPNEDSFFSVNKANLALGERIHFRLTFRTPPQNERPLPVDIRHNGRPIDRIMLLPRKTSGVYIAKSHYTPRYSGKYTATLATTSSENEQQARFMVYEDQREIREVSTNIQYLELLTQKSGGRLLEPNQIGDFPQLLSQSKPKEKKRTHLKSQWDQLWIFYLGALFFALEWYLRRKWGMN